MIMRAIRRLLGSDDAKGMDCREALEKVYDFLDGEMDASGAAAVEEHFQTCTQCYPHLKMEECFRRRMQEAVSRPEVPAGLRDRVMAVLTSDGPIEDTGIDCD